jgi:hypothetical protein
MPNQMLRWFGRANAHEQSLYLINTFHIELIGRNCCFVICAGSKGAVFRSYTHLNVNTFNNERNKALENPNNRKKFSTYY